MPRGYYGRRRTGYRRKGYYRGRRYSGRRRSLVGAPKRKFVTPYRSRQKLSIRRISGPNDLMPDKLMVTLKSFETMGAGLSGTASLNDDLVINGNDCVDPYAGDGSNQPMGFDQLGLFYEHFVCYGTDIEIEVLKTQDGLNKMFTIVVIPMNQSSVISTAIADSDLAESLNYARSQTIANSRQTVKITHSMTTKKMYGESFLAQSHYGGDTPFASAGSPQGTAPSRKWWWHIYGYENAHSLGAWVLSVQVRMMHKCIFMKKRPLPMSNT